MTNPFVTDLRAFHGDEAVKAKYLARVRAHTQADELVHGIYWEHGKGCAVGCTVHCADHSAYERELGIPSVLARLEDVLFERMGNGAAKTWPDRFLSTIPTGADLSLVWPRFAAWMLIDKTDGVIRFAKANRTKKAIRDVAALYERTINGEAVDRSEWVAVRRAAYAAADDDDDDAAAAAYAAADDDDADAAAAAYADDAAADAYAYAAAAAAADDDDDDAAAAAYAYADDAAADARSHFAIRASEKLLELLGEAPVLVTA